MLKAIRKKLDKKGFTLVELIVVLVILAILAALLIPALTGYIDRARDETIKAETRMVAMAVQTEAVTAYGANPNEFNTTGEWQADTHIAAIIELAEVKALTDTAKGGSFEAEIDAKGAIISVSYYDGAKTCTYTAANQTYVVDDDAAGAKKGPFDNIVSWSNGTSDS